MQALRWPMRDLELRLTGIRSCPLGAAYVSVGSFTSFWSRAGYFRSTPYQPTCVRKSDFVGKGQNRKS